MNILWDQVQSLREKVEKFGKITALSGIVFTSCTTKVGIEDVRAKLVEIADKLSFLQQPVPGFYLDALDYVAQRKAQHPYVNWKAFAQLVPDSGDGKSDQDASARAMATFLNHTGVITWFGNSELQDIVILNNKWLADLMASLISIPEKINWANGIVPLNGLQLAWNRIDQSLHGPLIKLLERYEILFPSVGTNSSHTSGLLAVRPLIVCVVFRPDHSWMDHSLYAAY